MMRNTILGNDLKDHQTLFGEQTFYRLDTLFDAVWSYLIVFGHVWSCWIKFEGHQTFDQKLGGRYFGRLDSRVSNMFDAGTRTTLAQLFVSIVWSVFDQICFNRLATHFNIDMFGHQTMFEVVIGKFSIINTPFAVSNMHFKGNTYIGNRFANMLWPRSYSRVFFSVESLTGSLSRIKQGQVPRGSGTTNYQSPH